MIVTHAHTKSNREPGVYLEYDGDATRIIAVDQEGHVVKRVEMPTALCQDSDVDECYEWLHRCEDRLAWACWREHTDPDTASRTRRPLASRSRRRAKGLAV